MVKEQIEKLTKLLEEKEIDTETLSLSSTD